MKPYFTIIIPATGRPELARDALNSVLAQDYLDFEVIFSNNGADIGVFNAVKDLLHDPRVRYLEQPNIISMPLHWEKLSLLAKGRYLSILTDRSVLKQSALANLASIHDDKNFTSEIVCWPWDIYYEDLRLYVKCKNLNSKYYELSSFSILRDSLKQLAGIDSRLPRGLNSCVSMKIINEARAKSGSVFHCLSPDLTFAYQCLMLRSKILYLSRSLMISQGISVSNGGLAGKSDATKYLKSLGLNSINAYEDICLKIPLVETTNFQDLINIVVKIYNKPELMDDDVKAYHYARCRLEIFLKKDSKIIPYEVIEGFEKKLNHSLAAENIEIQKKVKKILAIDKFKIKTLSKYLLSPFIKNKLVFIILLIINGANYQKRISYISGFGLNNFKKN